VEVFDPASTRVNRSVQFQELTDSDSDSEIYKRS
jgi:hypothetical protein